MTEAPAAHPPRQAKKPAMQTSRKTKQRNYESAPVAKHTLGRAPKPEMKP